MFKLCKLIWHMACICVGVLAHELLKIDEVNSGPRKVFLQRYTSCLYSTVYTGNSRPCSVFPQLISTWLPGHKLSHFTAKQCNTRCFWKHFMREMLITVTEYWLIFDQRCLVWPFDRSFSIDSCSETAGSSLALIGCFPPVCEILQMPLGAPEGTEAHDFFSDYLSHALLSGYSDRLIKISLF